MRFKTKMQPTLLYIVIMPIVCLIYLILRDMSFWLIVLFCFATAFNSLVLVLDRLRAAYVLTDEHFVNVAGIGSSKKPYSEIKLVETRQAGKRLRIYLDTGRKYKYPLHPKDPEGFLAELKKHLKEGQDAL